MDKLPIKKGLLTLMTLTLSVMLNWCDLTIDFMEQFEGIFADDPEEVVIEPLPEPEPEVELTGHVDLEGLSEAEFIIQMFSEMTEKETFQIVEREDERLENEPTTYYYDTVRNIYAQERNGIIEEYTYGTGTEHVLLRNPMTRHFSERREKSAEDPTYEERLMAANEEMADRFMELRWGQDYSVSLPALLIPEPELEQIENAEIYGDTVRGDLTQDYLEASNHFSMALSNLEATEALFVKIAVNPYTNTLIFSERYEFEDPETSERANSSLSGPEKRTYEVSETEKVFPELDDIGVIHENEAHRILRDHDLRAFYEKF